MSIITISRGSYSRGKEVAEMLSRALGYACLSREIILEGEGRAGPYNTMFLGVF